MHYPVNGLPPRETTQDYELFDTQPKAIHNTMTPVARSNVSKGTCLHSPTVPG